MNWTAIGALGQWVGAGAILVTLIYLSLQVKSVKDQTSHATHNHIYDTVNEFARMLAESESLSAIVVRGRESYFSLSPEEKIRFEGAYGFLLNFFENWLLQLEQMKTIREKDDAMKNIRMFLKVYCTYPGVQELWSHLHTLYTPTLNSLFDETANAA